MTVDVLEIAIECHCLPKVHQLQDAAMGPTGTSKVVKQVRHVSSQHVGLF